MSKEAIVLAGGFGTRLQSVLSDIPKPMAPIGDVPFLEYLLDYLLSEGIEHVVLSVGYRYETIMDYFGESYKGLRLSYVIEKTPLGTGGGIKASLSSCESDQVFVINGDTYFDVSLDVLRNHYNNEDLLMALYPMKNSDRYGSVELDERGRVLKFKEKQFFEFSLINGGIYLMSTKIFDQKGLADKFSFEKDLMEAYIDRANIYGMVFENYFVDIGIPSDYARAQIELPEL
jgi:D-glycero-alpha-D-manno-heptose 1-phosphate guanylyltransferase